MGLMDMVGGLMGGGGQGGNPMIQTVIGLIQNHPGGIQGLLGQFQQKGMGGQVASWISTGENQGISGDQIEQALGQEQVAGLASQLGVGTSEASSGLAQFLPMIVDKLSPQGELPSQEQSEQQGGLMGMLGGLLG